MEKALACNQLKQSVKGTRSGNINIFVQFLLILILAYVWIVQTGIAACHGYFLEIISRYMCFQDLNCLLERYLEPLKEEMFLTSDEIDNIFGNIQEIALFQRQFLHSLEEAIQLDSPFFQGTDIKHYRVRLCQTNN